MQVSLFVIRKINKLIVMRFSKTDLTLKILCNSSQHLTVDNSHIAGTHSAGSEDV